MAGEIAYWSADTPISMPIPTGEPGFVPMYGFVFTASGLAHDITQAEYDRLSVPDFSPDGRPNEVVYEDEDVDDEDFTQVEYF